MGGACFHAWRLTRLTPDGEHGGIPHNLIV
jgi:hypothetical protein